MILLQLGLNGSSKNIMTCVEQKTFTCSRGFKEWNRHWRNLLCSYSAAIVLGSSPSRKKTNQKVLMVFFMAFASVKHPTSHASVGRSFSCSNISARRRAPWPSTHDARYTNHKRQKNRDFLGDFLRARCFEVHCAPSRALRRLGAGNLSVCGREKRLSFHFFSQPVPKCNRRTRPGGFKKREGCNPAIHPTKPSEETQG